jgi:hypothetical protein
VGEKLADKKIMEPQIRTSDVVFRRFMNFSSILFSTCCHHILDDVLMS